jgi:two-component system response regulator
MIEFKEVEILLIEDDPNDVELTLRALKKNNFTNKIKVLNDGEEALDYIYSRGKYKHLDHTKPRFILLDLKLPKVDGIEVLKELKKNADTKTIPVVILTSSKEEKDRVQSYNLGVNSYIVKPVDFDKFVETVSQIGFYWMLLNQNPN